MARLKKQSSKKPVRFEQAIEQLEALIDQIESGQIGLEDALKHYERGMTLVKQCQQILGTAEKRMAKLTVDADGHLQADDRDDEDAD